MLARYAPAVQYIYMYINVLTSCAASEHSGGEDEVLEAEQQDDLNEGAQDNSGRQSSLHPMYVSIIKF